MGKLIDLTGQKFGRLTVLHKSELPETVISETEKNGHIGCANVTDLLLKTGGQIMISEEMQARARERMFDSKKDKRIMNAIILRESRFMEKSEREFEQAFPHFIKYRSYPGCAGDRYIDSYSEELWEVVIAKESIDYPHYKMIIDSTIDEKIFNNSIKYSIGRYCHDLKFF